MQSEARSAGAELLSSFTARQHSSATACATWYGAPMAIWRKVRLGALAAACLAGAAVACRQLVGIGDDPPRADTSACDMSYATTDCASCAASSCCKQSSGCAANPVCHAYETCLSGCEGGATCRARCALDYPPGMAAEVPALDACLAASCASACNLGCGSVATDFTPPDAAASCESCMGAQPCASERACAASLDCQSYVHCLAACPTFDCGEGCEAAHDAGVALFGPPFSTSGPVAGQLGGSCASACAFGANWLCVGHVSWPAAKVKSTMLHITIGAPVPGAVVKACGWMDSTCGTPIGIDPGTGQPFTIVDASGSATLEVATAATIPEGMYLEVTAPPSDAGEPAFVQTLAYLRAPLSESDKAIGTTVYTAATLDAVYTSAHLTRYCDAGSVDIDVRDCNLQNAPGATATTNYGAALRPYYGLDFGATATDVTGNVKFANVPPGVLDITVTPPEGGAPSSRAAVYARSNALTTVTMLPTP